MGTDNHASPPVNDPARKLGILAGGGALPRMIIKQCEKIGRPYFVVGFHGQTPENIAHVMTGFGSAGKIIDELKNAGVQDIVMAGKMKRPAFSEIKPDFRGAKIIAKIGLKKSLGDDTLLKILSDELEKDGFRVVGAHDLVEHVLMPKGLLGTITPDKQDNTDITRGIEVANTLGLADVGQSVVVEHGIVLAVEAAEGTDALLQRSKPLKRVNGKAGVLVKMKKPQQDSRFDLPTIGKITVDNVAAAGLKGIAVRAGGTILLDSEDIGAYADSLGVFIVGIEP